MKNKRVINNIKRDELAHILYKLDSFERVSGQELLITKEDIFDRESVNDKFEESKFGRLNDHIEKARLRLNKKIDQLSLDVSSMKNDSIDISDEDKKIILLEYEVRRRSGSINKEVEDFTVVLEKKVKAIKKSNKKTKKILDSSTLPENESSDAVTLEEYRINRIPKKSITTPFTNNKIKLTIACISIIALMFLITLIVVFVV